MTENLTFRAHSTRRREFSGVCFLVIRFDAVYAEFKVDKCVFRRPASYINFTTNRDTGQPFFRESRCFCFFSAFLQRAHDQLLCL